MPATAHRNILFCLFESLSRKDFDALERAGDLPILSRLRKGGVFFNRCYTPCPQSSPARASLFTGLDPSVHGLWTNGVALPDSETTFAQLLTSAGYSTYLAGRCQLAGVSRWTTEKVRPGEFSQMDWAHGPLHRSRQNAYLNWLEQNAPIEHSKLFTSQADPDKTEVSQQQRTALAELPDKLSFNRWTGKCVADWIKNASADKPLLAIAGYSVGDGLGAEPQPQGDFEGLNKAALRQADSAIGETLKQLHASDRAEDTVIVIASARGNCDDANSEMKEPSINVPLLFYQSGCDQQVIDTPVSTIDIAPTVLEFAQVARGSRMQGRALPYAGSRSEAGWAITRLRSNVSTGVGNWQTSICVNSMKLVVTHTDTEIQQNTMSLFNLEVDPEEQNNLALDQAYADTLEDMIDQMIDARCALEDRTEPRIAEF